MSDLTDTQAFNELKDSDDCITADQLRDLIEQQVDHSLDSKTVRARLRKISARDQAQLKGARWRIDKATALEQIEHYRKRTAS